MPQVAKVCLSARGRIVGRRPARGATGQRAAGRMHTTSKGWEARMDIESSPADRVRAGSGSTRPPHRWKKLDDRSSEAVIAAHQTVIAGGGPAGLTAAYELTRHGRSSVVLEADPNLVGGISRTDQYKGFRFDIGGHRFFSKSPEVNVIWREILGDQFITRP